MKPPLLRILSPEATPEPRRASLDAATEREAARIVDEVREGGEEALRRHAERLGDLEPEAPLCFDRARLEEALRSIDVETRELLERTAKRIARFAAAQRDALGAVKVPIPGGMAGQEVSPVGCAGCYAPGGRFPLPSSVLMTAVTARTAGVGQVWVASPRPAPATLAAAAVAGADGLLAVGGAQAIGALAHGVGGVPRADVIVGPGNRWVVAAKKHVFGAVGLDLLAGPSELVVLADESADPGWIAADLLAQAEHDPDALPVLVTTSRALAEAVERELAEQLATLPARELAAAALEGGFTILCDDLPTAVRACDRLAPEHLEVMVEDPAALTPAPSVYGALFLGAGSAEVLGDYGAGPNHVLPTAGGARFGGGLSVLSFLRVRTWLRIDDAGEAASLYEDAVRLARLEGLEGHARAATRRIQ